MKPTTQPFNFSHCFHPLSGTLQVRMIRPLRLNRVLCQKRNENFVRQRYSSPSLMILVFLNAKRPRREKWKEFILKIYCCSLLFINSQRLKGVYIKKIIGTKKKIRRMIKNRPRESIVSIFAFSYFVRRRQSLTRDKEHNPIFLFYFMNIKKIMFNVYYGHYK